MFGPGTWHVCLYITDSPWLTHAGDDAVDRKTCKAMIDGLRYASGAVPGAPGGFSVAPHEGRVLLFGDVDVEAGVWSAHDVARPRVQQDVGRVQSPHGNKAHAIPVDTHEHTLRSGDIVHALRCEVVIKS